MDTLEQNILDICRDFIEIVDRLYKSEQITYDQYVEMTKLKLEYINKMI